MIPNPSFPTMPYVANFIMRSTIAIKAFNPIMKMVTTGCDTSKRIPVRERELEVTSPYQARDTHHFVCEASLAGFESVRKIHKLKSFIRSDDQGLQTKDLSTNEFAARQINFVKLT